MFYFFFNCFQFVCFILVHDVHPFSSSSFNTTHIIRHLSFGQKIESIPNHGGNPLDSTESVAEEGNYLLFICKFFYLFFLDR